MRRFFRIALVGIFAALTVGVAISDGQGKAQPGQKTQPGVKVGPQGYQGPIGQTPWFNNPEIRQQFKLTDQQYGCAARQ